MKDQDKIYMESVYKNILESLLPFIEGRELYEMDRLAWLSCVSSSNSRIFGISTREMPPDIADRYANLRDKLRKNKKGDGFVSSFIASRICYEIEINKAITTQSPISLLFDNPLIDFNLCSSGSSRKNLTNFDLEMFFDIMQCSSDLQGIIRFLYSPCSEKIIWDKISFDSPLSDKITAGDILKNIV
jgi:hypothetical protein